jgi:hypothetical protein
MSDRFWLLWVDGRPTPRYMVCNMLDGAKAEAKRLSRKEGKTVYLIETISGTMTFAPDRDYYAALGAAADAMHAELLAQVDGLMGAEAEIEDGKTLSRLAALVERYEELRFLIEAPE